MKNWKTGPEIGINNIILVPSSVIRFLNYYYGFDNPATLVKIQVVIGLLRICGYLVVTSWYSTVQFYISEFLI